MHEQRVAVVDGVELAVRAHDGDPDLAPFVLVHGLASNAKLWDGVAARLADAGHRVAAVDLRGHGHSSKPDDGYDMATVARDVAALIDALGYERPVVAGQSWGGNVVLELAHLSPTSVRAIALVDGGWIHLADAFGTFDACAEVLKPPPLAGTPFARIQSGIRAMHPDWPAEGIEGALANFEVLPDGSVRPWLTLDRHLKVLRGLYEHRPRTRYPTIEVPVLLAPARPVSGQPRIDQLPAVEEAQDALPRARTRWFIGDHDIHAQHPAELSAALLDLAAWADEVTAR